MFWNKPKLPKPLGIYLLYGPELYIERPPIGLDVEMEDDDNDQQVRMLEHVTFWCIQNKFIADGRPVVEKALSHLPTRIYSLEFRSLVYADQLDSLIDTLKDTPADFSTARILALHTSLVALGDASFLTKFINKLYHGLELTSPSDGDQTWPEIHIALPYLWVLWLIQSVMLVQKYPPEILETK